MTIQVTAPSRLHFGLLSVTQEDFWLDRLGQATVPARRFGGVGLMIDRPGVQVSVRPSSSWSSSGPLAELIRVLLDAAEDGPAPLIASLAPALSDPARAILHALSVADDAIPEEIAARAVDDTLEWLRDQRRKQSEREITRRLRSAEHERASGEQGDEGFRRIHGSVRCCESLPRWRSVPMKPNV